MAMAMKIALAILLLANLPLTQEQSNANSPNNVGPYNPTSYETYNLDNPSTCTGVPRSVRSDRIFSITSSGNTQNTATPTSCQLTLTIDSAREPMVFKLTIVKSTIRDATVQFIIYDGEMSGRKLLGFNANQGPPTGAGYFFTTGQVVTFQLTRRERDFNYDIEIVAEPIKTDYINNKDCDPATGYGCDTYGYTYRLLGTKEIIGIVGGAFALIVLVVVVVVICCYRKQRGLNKRWKQDQLGSINTAASIHSFNGSAPTDKKSKGMWASESSKNGFPSSRRSPVLPRSRTARHSEEDDSVFESVDSYPTKKLQSRVHNSPTKWNQSNSRNYRPPTYQEALRQNSDVEVDSFVQGNDAHPQNTFVEREIIPRVKSSKIQKKVPPPLEEDETYDSIEPKKVTKAQNTDLEHDEEADVSNDESDEVSREEESEESGDEESEKEEAEDKKVVYSKPNKSKPQTQPEKEQSKSKTSEGNQTNKIQQKEGIPSNQQVQPPPNFVQGPSVQGFVLPGVIHPQPLYGYQLAQFQPQGYMYGQSGPMQVHHYPVPGTTDYPAPPMYPGPGYHNPKQGAYEKLVKPTELPVYSYLVNRGYTPLDGRHSPVSTSTAASNLSGDKLNLTDDTDFTANLGSGVELMRRNTEV
ncbi:hypothetical protein CHS0354_038355 [Potamilus streckersoni]|uniref:CUB domain-containing protein n=1 Tax=Potamilus streckersoni TaxID=2493646 RepID=A0AAE0S5U6_9BIVA|nr:hypothetical protein CHS0354_038355 [Potamilus streckersoni]